MNELAHRLAGNRPDGKPMLDARCIELDLFWITQRVIDTDLLDEAAIARTAAVSSYDSVKGCFFAASASETESYGHTGDPGIKSRHILQMLRSCVKECLFGEFESWFASSSCGGLVGACWTGRSPRTRTIFRNRS